MCHPSTFDNRVFDPTPLRTLARVYIINGIPSVRAAAVVEGRLHSLASGSLPVKNMLVLSTGRCSSPSCGSTFQSWRNSGNPRLGRGLRGANVGGDAGAQEALPWLKRSARVMASSVEAPGSDAVDSVNAVNAVNAGTAGKSATMGTSPRRQAARNVKQEKATYQVAAIAASSFVVASAIVATYLRISWHLDHDESFPYFDLLSTCLLAIGGMVGMEMYARVVHRHAWHDYQPGWLIHKSHHEPRTGPFELNDVYAIVNALPAIGLTGYGFLREDVVGGVCFGLGLGITLFGMAYMFVHDGLVHKRFPVGPVKDVPGLRRIAVAHRMHHMDDFQGYPYGMFLGPSELEAAGYGPALDRLVEKELEKEGRLRREQAVNARSER